MAKKMNGKDLTAYLLLTAGGLNWGLVEFLNFNLVDWLATLVSIPFVATIIYGLVAISSLYSVYTLVKLYN
jgi:uncharacterized membrane protein YuzA (DUF378 family)